MVYLRFGWLTVLSSRKIVEQELYFLLNCPGGCYEKHAKEQWQLCNTEAFFWGNVRILKRQISVSHNEAHSNVITFWSSSESSEIINSAKVTTTPAWDLLMLSSPKFLASLLPRNHAKIFLQAYSNTYIDLESKDEQDLYFCPHSKRVNGRVKKKSC